MHDLVVRENGTRKGGERPVFPSMEEGGPGRFLNTGEDLERRGRGDVVSETFQKERENN